PKAYAPKLTYLAMAATLTAFGIGTWVGRVTAPEQGNNAELVVAPNDRSIPDILAAGTKERSPLENAERARESSPTESPNDAQIHRTHTAARPRRADASRPAEPQQSISAGPEWLIRINAGDSTGALELLRKEPGGIEGAISASHSARELMAIADAARSKGG